MENEASAFAVQQEECDSLMAIYAEDFTLLRQDPVSYSIRLRPDVGVTDNLSLRLPATLALTVRYPPTYPETLPIFGVTSATVVTTVHGQNISTESTPLHAVQEEALLAAAATAARAAAGMPAVYGAVQAACDFLSRGGLAEAGLARLADDSLAHILSYLATSRAAIGAVCVALPLFAAAAETNAVWRPLCRRRWGEKWGFARRWRGALERCGAQSDRHCWRRAYEDAEREARRTVLAREELVALTFDYRQWFSFAAFRQQPTNMRDVLPTGLRHSIARDVAFLATGAVQSEEREFLRRLAWKANDDENIAEVALRLAGNGRSSVEHLTVRRLSNWGWQLSGSDYVLRAIDDEGFTATLWEDLTEHLILEEKPEWIAARRSPYPYQYREIPDDAEYKIRLDW